MAARIENPTLTVPGAVDAAQKLGASATTAGIPKTRRHLQRFAGPFGRQG
jgi:hypothetical protein